MCPRPSFQSSIKRLSPVKYWSLGLCFLAIVGLTDYHTGYELTFPSFYFFPVFWVSWRGKWYSGIAISVLSSFVWFVADTVNRHPYSTEFYRYWNVLIWFVAFMVVSILVMRMRVLLDREKQSRESLDRAFQELFASQQQTLAESDAKLKALNELRHADRLKTVGRLAAGVAHELGTPLNVISGRPHLMMSEDIGRGKLERNIAIIEDQVDRMTAIIQGLLDFARPHPMATSEHELGPVLTRTMELLQPLGKKNAVSFSCRLPEKPIVARIDLAQIQQVTTNLLLNAIQAMPHGGMVEMSVENVTASSPDEQERGARPWACISISDDGPGISPETMAHLFEPFFTTKDVGEGTGLGLSIVYGIVSEHGGWITVDSQEGKGSCFRVFLPLED